MEFRFILQTVFEVGVAAFIIYGLLFEEKFVAAERRLFAFFKRKVRRALSSHKPSAQVVHADKAS